MGIKPVIRDLIEKGIDPKTAIIGNDGLFQDPIIYSETTDISESPAPYLRNGLVLLSESTESNKPRKPRKPKAE